MTEQELIERFVDANFEQEIRETMSRTDILGLDYLNGLQHGLNFAFTEFAKGLLAPDIEDPNVRLDRVYAFLHWTIMKETQILADMQFITEHSSKYMINQSRLTDERIKK